MANIVINDETFPGVASVTLNTDSDTATFLSTDYVLVGTPEVAETVADMTETDKIYVYVGSETGYTAGNWYYFNGTSWESGGEYGSSTGGISDNARNLLKYILDRVAYTETGMETYVNALYQALKIVGPAPEQYTILNTLVNVTNSNGATSIAEGSAYSATLSVETGYTWGTVSVSMGGIDITSTAYDSTTHVISIASVTGNIEIIASATAPVTTYLITNALTHVTNSNSSASIQSGSAYSATLTADTDYTIDSVTVTMGGVDITATAYDSSDNSITIASVTGDIVITASAVEAIANPNLNYLFSDITFTDGYINDTGEISSLSDNKFWNEYVPNADGFCLVKSDGTMYFNANCTLRLAEYDGSKTFIARSYAQYSTGTYRTDSIMGANSPSYIKMGFSNATNVLANAERFVGLNILDTSICTIANSTIDTNGDVQSSSGSNVSDFLPVDEGYVVGKLNGNDSALIVFYDTSKVFISRHALTTGSNNKEEIISVPSNAKYVRFRCPTTPNANIYVSYAK